MRKFNDKETHPNPPLESEGTKKVRHAECRMTGEAVRNNGKGCHCEGGTTEAVHQPKAGSILQSQLAKNPALFEKVISLLTFHISRKRRAFTLAEILITLGIIGVVAAITIPALIDNYQKHEIPIRLKKMYNTLHNAIQLAEVENGSSENWRFSSDAEAKEFYDNKILPI